MELNKTFTATMAKSEERGTWTYVVWPESAEFFGTKGHVKVRGTIDDQPFKAGFTPMGGGVHMLPIKTEIRKAIGKEAGDTVIIHLEEHL